MKKMIATLILFSLSTPAFASECFSKWGIRDFKYVGDYTIQVEANGRKLYNVKTIACFDLPHAMAIDFDSRGSSQVCRGDDILIVDQFTGRIEDRCMITDITKVEN